MPVLLRVPWGGVKRPLDPSKLSPTLAENSWKMIARASEEGIASTLWKVGDEIDIVLSGDYKGSITMQIPGFDHDALASGGKAGITFLSKQVLGAEVMGENTRELGWRDTPIRMDVAPKIMASLPADLQSAIKQVVKSSSEGTVTSGGVYTTEDYVFIPSLSEVFDPGTIDKKFTWEDNAKFAKTDGTRYAVFGTDEDVEKRLISGGAASWWTRSSFYNRINYFLCVGEDAGVPYKRNYDASHICFGFCI